MAEEKQFGKEGWTPERLGDLTGKTFVITGSNSGIGYEASKIFLSKGGKVIMLNRNEDKTTKAIETIKSELGSEVEISFVRMDLRQFSSVKDAAEQVKEMVPEIDALICNAAVAQIAKQEKTTYGHETQLGVNYYSHFLLVNLLLDTVKRVVILTSNGYKMGLRKLQLDDMNFDNNYDPMTTYCHSKLAQMVFGYELQKRIDEAGRDIKVYVCHPGFSRTNLVNETANFMSNFLFQIFVRLPISQSAEKGAYSMVLCSTEGDLKDKTIYGPNGFQGFIGPVEENKLEDFVLEQDADALWKISETETGMSFEV